MLYGEQSECTTEQESMPEERVRKPPTKLEHSQHPDAHMSEATSQPTNNQYQGTSCTAPRIPISSSMDEPRDVVIASDSSGGDGAGGFDIEEWIDPNYLGR